MARSTVQKPKYRRPKAAVRVRPPRRKRTQRDYVRSNAKAINRLSKSVTALTMGSYGKIQKNYQEVTALNPLDSQPICFDATDFTARRTDSGGVELMPGCKVYQVDNTGTNITVQDKWKIAANTVNNPFWDATNADLVGDTGSYKPIQADYFFKIYAGRNRIDDAWVDIRLITLKPGAAALVGAPSSANFAERVLPRGLKFMKYLTDGNNAINNDYFRTYRHMRIYLNSQTNITAPTPSTTAAQVGQTSTTGNSKFRNLTIRPKGVKQQLQSFPDPNEPETIVNAGNDVQDGPYGFRNVPLTSPLWLLISTNDATTLDGDGVYLDIRRKVIWRDQMGGTSIMANGRTVGALGVPVRGGTKFI